MLEPRQHPEMTHACCLTCSRGSRQLALSYTIPTEGKHELSTGSTHQRVRGSPGEDDAFLEGWERAREYLSRQDGYLSTHLHRSLMPNADFGLVNVARRESQEAFQAAMAQPELKGASIPFPFHASLYEVIREDEP